MFEIGHVHRVRSVLDLLAQLVVLHLQVVQVILTPCNLHLQRA